ncbi:sodium- and chloride-dependent GABA transporter 3-like [Haliotis rufescens]|uniref:sodium- and chloride-dependent GABA transporter 3-like n=1 Tax=Haliotis rufescens TaxID=6454 RepID=UPI00201F5F0A|nr:sodium- and chloride-dependent GABA transporter 3-like [Haliotis rufescens]
MVHERWTHHFDYLTTLLGYSIGAGTFLKFPYLSMRNGGGAFLIPFLIFTVIGAIPCVFLEMVIGQFSQSGPVEVWNVCPPFKGIGLGTVFISWTYATYNASIFAWYLYYFVHSFAANLPWAHCNNDWNTDRCISPRGFGNTSSSNITTYFDNVTTYSDNLTPYTDNLTTYSDNLTAVSSAATLYSTNGSVVGVTAAEEFWRYKVLEITSGLDHLGGIRWPLAGFLAVAIVAAFFSVLWGIKVSGKIVYITVSVPYILNTVFLIRGCLLPGSAEGIYYYIYPDFEKLLYPRVWLEACAYSLFSMGIGMGCIITMSGHNKFNNNCLRDSIVMCLVDAVSCIYVGFSVFAIIGHVAHQRGLTVEDFQSSGFNLAFIVFPEVVSALPLPQLWSALTFIMLVLLLIDTLIPTYEMVVTALTDRVPALARRRWLATVLVLAASGLVSLVYVSQGGIYVITLVDWYATFPSLALFATMECIAISWCYGTKRLEDDIANMWGRTIPRHISFCLRYISPPLLLAVFGFSLYSYRPPRYGEYTFPDWATGLGWIISFASILPFPILFIWTVYQTHGDTIKEKLQNALKPSLKWGCQDQVASDGQDVLQTMMSTKM